MGFSISLLCEIVKLSCVAQLYPFFLFQETKFELYFLPALSLCFLNLRYRLSKPVPRVGRWIKVDSVALCQKQIRPF